MVSTTGITPHNAITPIRPQPGLTANAPHAVSAALAGVAATGSTVTFFLPGVLSGPDVMNGSARGTALVMLVVGLPVLLGAMLLARRGSDRAVIVLLGTVGYLAYNAVMLLFATPFNQLFLLYVATLSLALASVAAVCAHLDVRALAGRFAPDTPARGLALYIWVVVALNALAWLRVIVPALGDPAGPSFLRGTGMTTSPVYVQDLAVWLPLAAVSALWLWQRKPWGLVIGGAYLTMWVLESLTIATDQWFGHQADPTSPVASSSVVAPFAVFALVGCLPLVLLLRRLLAPAAIAPDQQPSA
jgi:hypothetical protein